MVLVEDEADSSDIDLGELRHWAEVVLAAEGYPATAQLALILVSDDWMAELHRQALGEKRPTDVLSFPIDRLQPGAPPAAAVPPIVVGDVFLAPDYIRRQAAELGVDLQDELALLVTHGVLHCLGYDHAAESDADIMEARERELLAASGRERR